MDPRVAENLVKLKAKQDEISQLITRLATEETGEDKTRMEGELTTAKAEEKNVKDSIIELMIQTSDSSQESSGKPQQDLDVNHIKSHDPSPRNFQFAPKLPVLQQYRHGENFLTWSARFKRFLKIGRYTLDDSIIDLLLQNVE
jgi:seryl-tRNA synthetase